MELIWVLECVAMLCNPTSALARTWGTKQECRAAVIANLNSRSENMRFTWRCVERKAVVTQKSEPVTAESLERP